MDILAEAYHAFRHMTPCSQDVKESLEDVKRYPGK